jgi:hypothetical protein
VRGLLDRLPASVSWDDIQYHIYVVQRIQQAIESAGRRELIPHEEVVKRMAYWLEGKD